MALDIARVILEIIPRIIFFIAIVRSKMYDSIRSDI